MHHHVCAFSGFNLTLQVAGVNSTVSGPAAQIPASSLQPVQPVYSTSLESLNLTVRVQGAGIVPFSASLQRELVSALLHVSPGTCIVAMYVLHKYAMHNTLRSCCSFIDLLSRMAALHLVHCTTRLVRARSLLPAEHYLIARQHGSK